MTIRILASFLIIVGLSTPSLSDDGISFTQQLADYQITPDRLSTGMYVYVEYTGNSIEERTISGYITSVDSINIVVRKSPLYRKTIYYEQIEYMIIGSSRESVDDMVADITDVQRETGKTNYNRSLLIGIPIGAGIGYLVSEGVNSIQRDGLIDSRPPWDEPWISKEQERDNNIQGIVLGGLIIGVPLSMLLGKITSSQFINSPVQLNIGPNNRRYIKMTWEIGK